MDFGRRLLPQVVDYYADAEPTRVYASIPNSSDHLSDGFQDVTMAKLAAMVNRLCWWLHDSLGVGNLDTIAYIGPADIRYALVFLTAVKCRYKVLFISPRNTILQNQGMIIQSECQALFYAEELAAVANSLWSTGLPDLVMKVVPSLGDLLQTPDDTKHYQFDRSFDDARDEPCLILHSSGSTGHPKLVTMTHGTFACTDNDRNMPVPEGRSPQNAAQFNFEGGGRFYSCFPPYHLAGVHAFIDLPIFSNSATVVFGPTNLPPSGYLLSEILKHQRVCAFYVPPFIIEQWAAEPAAEEQAKQLKFVLFGGGPLSPHIGERLSQSVNVCQMYGSLEIGQVQLLVPQPGEWSYMELNPFEEADMQPCGDGTYEMVLHQDPKFASRRSVWHNFPDVKEWRTGDIFVPHPSKTELWRYHGRLDDLIVLSTSHKLRPIEMETLIQGDPLLSGALIAGQGKPEPVLLVEPKPGTYDDTQSRQAFIERIWPTIEEANRMAPSYAKIHRSKVLLADAKRPFIRAPKGSIVRKLTTNAYAEEIDAAYAEETSCDDPATAHESISSFDLPRLKLLVRNHMEELLQGVALSDTDNIFQVGLDSLGAATLSRTLQKELRKQINLAGGNTKSISLRLVYTHPTVGALASVIHKIITTGEVPDDSISKDAEDMERILAELTESLPPKDAVNGNAKLNVALIGPRGSLGPNIVRELMRDQRVAKVYCLNRGDNGKEILRSILEERDLSCELDDDRLAFMSVDLGKPRLGLSPSDLNELLNNVNVIIHNAWRVDFGWTLASYKDVYLHSVRELVALSALSPLRPRIAFVSSVSSVQEWAAVFPDRPVAEAPLDSYKVASPLGYGQSKHISERLLAEASTRCGTPVSILRVGQVAGPTDPSAGGGRWSMDEWIPSLAAISRALRLVPKDIPPIDWVPVDLAARAIVELALVGDGVDTACESSHQPLRVFNIVNPNLSPWSIFADALQKRLTEPGDADCCRQTSLTEWVDALVRTDTDTMSEADAKSSVKILPFFQHLAETAARGVMLQPKFDTTEAMRNSKTMAEMGGIGSELIDQWLRQWGL